LKLAAAGGQVIVGAVAYVTAVVSENAQSDMSVRSPRVRVIQAPLNSNVCRYGGGNDCPSHLGRSE
jgi:hypothetical protein